MRFIKPLGLLLLFGFSPSFGLTQNPGDLISVNCLATYSKSNVRDFTKSKHLPKVIVPVRHAIEFYHLEFWTRDFDSSLVKASGLIVIPIDMDESAPLISYQKGTRLKKEVPEASLDGENLILAVLATDGYAVCSPDYLGLGTSDGLQYYMHAQTEAWTVIDQLRAARIFLDSINFSLDSQLFLTGYSQGGHATMAAQREIEQNYSSEFDLTAVGPMSGPYDLEGSQFNMVSPDESFNRPGYLPFLLVGLNRVYQFVDETSAMFVSPYDSLLPPLLKGENNLSAVHRLMPEDPFDALHPSFKQKLLGDSSSSFAQILEENTVYDFVPEAPVNLCYCKKDEVVAYENSLVAFEFFKSNGAKNVRKDRVAKKLNHLECARYALIYQKFWFDSFRKGKKRGRKGPFFKRGMVALSKLF